MIRYKIDTLQRNKHDAVRAFDCELEALHKAKADIECDVAHGHVKKIVMEQELACLFSFQSRENCIEDKINAKQNEQRQLNRTITDCGLRLEEKTKVDPMPAFRQQLQSKFDQVVPTAHQDRDYFLKFLSQKTDATQDKHHESETDDSASDEGIDDLDVDDEAPENVDRVMAPFPRTHVTSFY